MASKVYLSHSNDKRDFASTLARLLEDRGISCCMAWQEVCAASSLRSVIEESDWFVILMDEDTSSSFSVLNELQLAMQMGKNILPVLFDNVLSPGYQFQMGTYKMLDCQNMTIEATADHIAAVVAPTAHSHPEKVVPYAGALSYIFVSYSHRDTKSVLSVLAELQQHGFRIWYDEGIEPGTDWDDFIAQKIEDCGLVLSFISKNYIDSNNCKDELNFARDLDKKRLLVYLENVELPAGMAMRLNRLQAVHQYLYPDMDSFMDKLLCTEVMQAFSD